MPTVGRECQIILDGTGYWIEPDSFAMARPRVRRSDLTVTGSSGSAGAAERYLDLGPGKREWAFTVIAAQAIRDYAGQTITTTGQSVRDALHTSYEKVATALSFTDPHNVAWSVYFDDLQEQLLNVRAQPDGELQYLLAVTLVEA